MMSVTASERLTAYHLWLASRPEPSAGIMAGLETARPISLDAEGLRAEGWEGDMPRGWAVAAGEPLRIGGYNEDRGIYDSDVFAGDGGERRTLHLGIDLFAPAGTEVFAPLSGSVHSFQDNNNIKDYGPTVIVQHEPRPGLTFWTLYGHLSRESLDGLFAGKVFNAGDRLARLGDDSVNGGWSPHLHFQVILDLGGRSGDFPGVFKRSERDPWTQVCPDPRPLLGLTHL